MRPRVHVETTVLSYLAARPSRDPLTKGRQALTALWWETERSKYDLVVSAAVESECQLGDPQQISRRRELLHQTSLLPVNDRVLELAKALIARGALPATAGPDAIHIAAAVVHECEYLLTWNFRHIANAQIRRAVERIVVQHGYTKTTICTPEELF